MLKFLAVLRMAMIDATIYRDDMLLWSLSLMIGPMVYLVVWLAVSATGNNLPLTSVQFVQYFLLVVLVRIWANAWHSQIVAADIRSGAISKFFLKPIPYLVYRFGDNIGYRLIKGLFGLAVFLLLALIFHMQIPQ